MPDQFATPRLTEVQVPFKLRPLFFSLFFSTQFQNTFLDRSWLERDKFFPATQWQGSARVWRRR
jgi:hypothetical protein